MKRRNFLLGSAALSGGLISSALPLGAQTLRQPSPSTAAPASAGAALTPSSTPVITGHTKMLR